MKPRQRGCVALPNSGKTSAFSKLWSAFQAERERLKAESKAKLEQQKSELKRFGMEFFERSTEDFTFSEEGTVPEDYELVPGDELEASFYNLKGGSSSRTLVVDESGVANIAGLGPITLGGATRAQAEQRLNQALGSSRLKNLQAQVRITKLSRMRVFVVGEAVRPGGYLVNPGATPLDALFRAGGPGQRGSFRNIEVKRKNGTLVRVDLYDLLLKGQTSLQRLKPGDRVFIPVTGPQVTVIGEVSRPAIYEIQGKANLQGILRLAGGVAPQAYFPTARIERVATNTDRVLVDVDLKSTVPVLPGDTIVVESVLETARNGVYLDGAVKRPGWYQLTSGMRVSQLIRRAQGLEEGAFPGQAEIIRRESPEAPLALIGFDISKALSGDSANNLRLKADDVVVVFDREVAEFEAGRVRVQGEVTRPGNIRDTKK
jgi:polysaccharide export outer membrane protein